MVLRFPIADLEKVVEPDNLCDVLDSLLEMEKLSGYYYNWETGEVDLDIPDCSLIEEMFKDFSKGRLN